MPGLTFLAGETVELRTIESEDLEFLQQASTTPKSELVSLPSRREIDSSRRNGSIR